MAWGDLPGQVVDAPEVLLHGLPEAGHVGGPLVGAMEGHALLDQGVVGREVVADPVALLEVALLLLVRVQVLHAEVEPAPVAGRLLHRDLGLLLPREGEELSRLGEGPVDQLLGHAVAAQVGEADVAEGGGQLQGGPLALVGPAGAEGLEVDHGDLLEGDAVGLQGRRDLGGHEVFTPMPMLGSMNSLVYRS